MDDTASALEQFRQQWKDEVSARAQKPDSSRQGPRRARLSGGPADHPIHRPPTRHPVADAKDESEQPTDTDKASDHVAKARRRSAAREAHDERSDLVDHADHDDFVVKRPAREPQSALEHFERAIEKEGQGNLGDSLSHYRKAYRLDAKVEQSYKNKHFPQHRGPLPSSTPHEPHAPTPERPTAPVAPDKPGEALTMTELIDSLADCRIASATPVIAGNVPPRCPLQTLPTEVLLDLLQVVAVRDPAVFVRLALVCKKLAYHVWTDNAIWKRVALGPEFGLGGQRYGFVVDLQGREIDSRTLELESPRHNGTLSPATLEAWFAPATSWRDVFHQHPRIRFTGVYISTVNYTRPGGASATAITWTNPIHVVTYYRYLRFYRDGTCISLLTTNEPVDVVHHLTRENLAFVRSGRKDAGHASHLAPAGPASVNAKEVAPSPSATAGGSLAVGAPPPAAQHVMKHALRGRWRLCHPSLDSTDMEVGVGVGAAGAMAPTIAATPRPISPGDLHIETEGAGPRYQYTMHLSLRTAGSARSKHTTKNNKLQWQGFWSYNLLTSDWAEFTLRHDKPFYFSRVRAYGLGY